MSNAFPLLISFVICLLEESNQMGVPIISVARYLSIEERFLSGVERCLAGQK